MAAKKATRKATKRPNTAAKNGDAGAAVLAKIAAMPAPHRAIGERLHALILASAPALQPTLYYGMPWYAKDGTRICFFRADEYVTFGLTEDANLALAEGAAHRLLPCAWYVPALDDATEAALAAIVRSAAG